MTRQRVPHAEGAIHLGHGLQVANLSDQQVVLRGSPGLVIRSSFELRIDREDLPYTVVLNVGVADGVPTCEAVRCYRRAGGLAVTTAGMRQVPVDRLMTEAILRLPLVAPARDAGKQWSYRPDPEAVQQALARSRRRVGMTPELLHEVAEVYRAAMASHTERHRPTEAVREHFSRQLGTEVEPRRASRWVTAARRAGLLDAGPAPTRRASTRGGGDEAS